MTTVVTGASGFIGSVLVRELLSRGRSVRAVVRSNRKGLEGLDIEIVEADVRNPSSLRSAFDGAESVFHLASVITLAGDRSGQVTETNVKGAENAARAALDAGVKKFVHCSSIHVFDLKDRGVAIDEDTKRISAAHPVYDRTKAAGEAAVREVIKLGLPGVIIHPTGVMGPGDHRPSRVGQALLDLSSKKLPALISGGFNWVDVRDVCAGAISAEESGHVGGGYILSGAWHSTRELATFGEELTRMAPPRLEVPMWMARNLAPLGNFLGWLNRTEFRLNSGTVSALSGARTISCAKAKRELGYRSRSIRQSVHDTYKWFEESGMLKRPLPVNDGYQP